MQSTMGDTMGVAVADDAKDFCACEMFSALNEGACGESTRTAVGRRGTGMKECAHRATNAVVSGE